MELWGMDLGARDLIAGYAAGLSTILAIGTVLARRPVVAFVPCVMKGGLDRRSVCLRVYNPSRRPIQITKLRLRADHEDSLRVGVWPLGDHAPDELYRENWAEQRGSGVVDLPVFIPGGGTVDIRIADIRANTAGWLVFSWHRHGWFPRFPFIRRVTGRLRSIGAGTVDWPTPANGKLSTDK